MEIDSLLKKARQNFENHRLPEARTLYLKILKTIPSETTKAIVSAELSWVYYYENKFQQAAEAAEKVLLLNPDYSARDDVYRILGYAYLGLKDFALAERYLSLSLEENKLENKQQYVKYELAKLHFSKGSYDLAYPYFNEILDFFEKTDTEYFLSVLFYLGFVYYYLNNLKKAKVYFSQILEAETSNQRKASSYFGIDFIEFSEKNYLRVIALCEKVMTLDNAFFDKESLGFLTAVSYNFLGRKDIFEQYYSEMKKNYPSGRYKKELEQIQNSNLKDKK